jgi:ribose 5-phosphate isomerase A
MSADAQKAAAAAAAADLIEGGMTVGLGSGSTAALFVRALAARGLSIRAVATSDATASLARELGIEVMELDSVPRIDLTVDGADQIGPGLALIKGGGAALLREKLVWEASDRCVAIADAGKVEGPFGRYPLPIEVVAFGHATTAARIDAALEAQGLGVRCALRQIGSDPVRTDSGNLIYDAPCGAIADPAALAVALKALTGVVEHGLFLGPFRHRRGLGRGARRALGGHAGRPRRRGRIPPRGRHLRHTRLHPQEVHGLCQRGLGPGQDGQGLWLDDRRGQFRLAGLSGGQGHRDRPPLGSLCH